MNWVMNLVSEFSSIELGIAVYITVISIIAFIIIGFDKKKAKKGEWRVREATLIVISILGGAMGTMVGMVFFKHKINKKKFYIGVPVIYILNRIMLIIISAYIG